MAGSNLDVIRATRSAAMAGLSWSSDELAFCAETYDTGPLGQLVKTGVIKHQGFMAFSYKYLAQKHPGVVEQYAFGFYDETTGSFSEVRGSGSDLWKMFFTGGSNPETDCACGLNPRRGLEELATTVAEIQPAFYALYRRKRGVICILFRRDLPAQKVAASVAAQPNALHGQVTG